MIFAIVSNMIIVNNFEKIMLLSDPAFWVKIYQYRFTVCPLTTIITILIWRAQDDSGIQPEWSGDPWVARSWAIQWAI